MFNYLILLGFFNAFYSPVGLLSYLCGVKIFKVKLRLFDVLFLLYLVTIFISNLLFSDMVLATSTIRFYFGFFCFYVYFKSGAEFPVKKIIFFLLLAIPLEALLINTIISAVNMPNFPSENAVSHFNVGGYQRPYSFAGNSAVGSSILVVMLSMSPVSNVVMSLVMGCVFIFSSGSGFFSLILMSLLKKIKLTIIFSGIIFLFLIVFHSNIIEFIDSLGLKLNSKYILFLIDFKMEQISSLFYGFSWFELMFGRLDSLLVSGYGGDFGWLYFILGYGFFSFLFILIFILSKATKKNVIPIIIILVSTFHYPVMFFLPGQILLGYLMAQKYRTSSLL
ncbi:MAG: hypothetical protein HRT73_01775 [Flavobacteriales bacterium]|nr:hypothetical protein [Flavobacteriales bacterium]